MYFSKIRTPPTFFFACSTSKLMPKFEKKKNFSTVANGQLKGCAGVFSLSLNQSGFNSGSYSAAKDLQISKNFLKMSKNF